MAETNSTSGQRTGTTNSRRSSATTRRTPSTSGQKAAATRKRNAASRSATTTKANVKRTATSAKTTASSASDATAAESKVIVTQVQQIAERAVLVPVGAGLLARDNLVSTVNGLATKFGTRAAAERELKRYERRGATARNRLVIWLVTSSSCCVVTDERTGTNVATRCCDGPFD